MTDIFNNPFEDINANNIDMKKIVEYWCNPFRKGAITSLNEKKFRTSRMPIILQGSRGSGKTTILKYYSFDAQCERAKKDTNTSIMDVIRKDGEVGFYFRCEEAFIKAFSSAFKDVNPDKWTSIFDCYLELFFSLEILDMLIVLHKQGEIEELSKESIKSIANNIGNQKLEMCNSLSDLRNEVHKGLVYFEAYKNESIFDDREFKPIIFVDIFTFSYSLIQEIKSHFPRFSDTIFILMIDEYENLNDELQRRINTAIKFVKQDISIRVGRRCEGNFVTKTVNECEYLRKNHDYFLAPLDSELDVQKVREYFMEVANLRFENTNVRLPNGATPSIINMLGDKEDPVEECRRICGKKKTHLDMILKQSKNLNSDDELRNKIIEIISNDENPIAETLNALWVIRSKEDPVKTAKLAVLAMAAFINGEENEESPKYRNDYSNKYRYAITIFICSVYKKDKLYYGFNALCHLSNGNVRAFINFCQSIINDALFYEKENFLNTGIVSKDVQSNAIRSFSRSEFEDICSIVNSGDKIKNFILNLGNSFSAFHKDKRIRYPELNQFNFDETRLLFDDRNEIRTAEKWAVIIKRKKVQRASAGVDERTELFYMNKMFSPLFNISYRTRGGINLLLSPEEVHDMLYYDSYLPRKAAIINNELDHIKDKNQKEEKQTDKLKQLSLFDAETEDE